MQHFVAEDGARLAFRDEGEGLPVLALAGLTRDGRDFDYLARHLHGIRLIRLDSRGRGQSDWTGPDSYTIVQESRDVLALLDHLALPSVAVIGASRGGLIGMALAATARERVLGLCLNDIGPVLEPEGLARIGQYVGIAPSVPTLAEVADRMAAAMPGFANVPDWRWQEETVRHYHKAGPAGVVLSYDPALRQAFEAALAAPAVDMWPMFQACADIPLALVRGANSDLLSAATAAEMARRIPAMIHAEVPDRGHIPFLDEPEALDAIAAWLARLGVPDAVVAPDGQLS